MALAQAEIAEISDSMSLSENSSDFSLVSQMLFPGPETLVPQKPKKSRIFPEGHHRGHVWPAGRAQPAARCLLPAENTVDLMLHLCSYVVAVDPHIFISVIYSQFCDHRHT